MASCRHHPGRAHNWRDGDHDALDVRGGQPGPLYRRGVGQVGGGGASIAIRAASLASMKSRGETEWCSIEAVVMSTIVSRTGVSELTDPPAISAERDSPSHGWVRL